MSRRVRLAYAFAWGVVNHALFVVAIATMVAALYSGLSTGFGRFAGAHAWGVNGLLVAQFPILHSFLLSQGGRRWLEKLAPAELARDLAPTTFTIIASLQVLLAFAAWTPSGIVLWEASGVWLWLARAAFAGSWLFLVVALTQAGLASQTGLIGWWSVVRGRKPQFGAFPTHGLFRRCRQPVYLAFALTLWTGPVHTLDGLLLALSWTVYCIAAPLHKELRYLSFYGERFAQYRASVPYILPRLKS